jgi:UDP-N-acetylglucosamine--N-acetylmuramyl-(pentapeptide) pyrophosphoryl-undecaprenol N-acetylglucosamine transferase
MSRSSTNPHIAIACGGTGGHLFPGLAVAEVLQQWDCKLTLLVSSKEVDQEAVKAAIGMQVMALPAVGLQRGQRMRFLHGSWSSYRLCRASFEKAPPTAVLGMGGFTSAPPVLAGKAMGARTFLHESNSIPGRANRWLAPWVDEIFVGFPMAARRFSSQSVRLTGTPVRSQFRESDVASCRISVGLQPNAPVLLIMGGSQGASGINALVQKAIPILAQSAPELQFLHLTGPADHQQVQAAYLQAKRRATVRPFLSEIEFALGAATIAVTRAGASSLAELAATRVPSLLIPYPHAADNHQFFNAQAFVQSNAAGMLEQHEATPESFASTIVGWLRDPARIGGMKAALASWHYPKAALDIATAMFDRLGLAVPAPLPLEEGPASLPPRPGLGRSWKEDRARAAAAAPSRPAP